MSPNIHIHLKVQEKFSTVKGISWNRAMDEVRTDRLVAKHGKETLLVIIRDWPVSEKYKSKPEMVASLEYLVGVANLIILNPGGTQVYEGSGGANGAKFLYPKKVQLG